MRIGDTTLRTWFERDRSHVELVGPDDETIIEWWDEDVEVDCELGFLVMGRGERRLHESAFDTAVHRGIIEED